MSYHETFDHLGNQVAPSTRWTRADRARIALAVVLVLAAIYMGVAS